jgi:hypothetical protein
MFRSVCLDNVVELDSMSHIIDMDPNDQLPMLIFRDFSAAFPSIAHLFIFIALRAAGFPVEVINFIKAL